MQGGGRAWIWPASPLLQYPPSLIQHQIFSLLGKDILVVRIDLGRHVLMCWAEQQCRDHSPLYSQPSESYVSDLLRRKRGHVGQSLQK